MRRLTRRLFTLAAAVSLLLCAAAGVMWVRSHYVFDGVRWPARPASGDAIRLTLFTRHGAAHLVCVWRPDARSSPGLPRLHGPQFPRYTVLTDRPTHHAAGFGLRRHADWGFVSVPFWLVMVGTGIPPALWKWRRERQHAVAAAGLCRACGYDLRATPDRCPECGTAAAAG